MSLMREDILTYIEAIVTDSFKTTQELPWQKDGQSLYLKNFKYIYVDRPQTTQEPLYDTLDGLGIVNEITTISVYFATDAKTLPSGYDEQVTLIKSGRFDTSTTGQTQRTSIVSTEYEGDALVTQVDYSFTQIM